MALPQSNPYLVLKVGGALLQDKQALGALLQVLEQISNVFAPVLVHGGGATTQLLLEQLGFNSEKQNGIRITPTAHLPYVVGALAGTVNTQICAQASTTALKPVGLTLLDGGITVAQQKQDRFGAVGDVKPGDAQLLTTLIAAGFLPVISSIAGDGQGNLLNVNADDAAAAIAQLLEADLVLLSDVAGVLDTEKKLIPSLSHSQITQLCDSGVIQGGMVAKVKSALTTANQTQKSVFISSWKTPEQILALSHGQPCGTCVLPDLIQGNSI